MADFTVQIQRTQTFFTNITIDAEDEDAAEEIANDLCNSRDTTALDAAMKAENAEWDLDDDSYEVIEVNEA